MAAWDDHKYVRPEPGSSWTILPSGAAIFNVTGSVTVTPASGAQFDISDRPVRALGVVTTDDTDNAILRELRAIRELLRLLLMDHGYTPDVASLLTETAA